MTRNSSFDLPMESLEFTSGSSESDDEVQRILDSASSNIEQAQDSGKSKQFPKRYGDQRLFAIDSVMDSLDAHLKAFPPKDHDSSIPVCEENMIEPTKGSTDANLDTNTLATTLSEMDRIAAKVYSHNTYGIDEQLQNISESPYCEDKNHSDTAQTNDMASTLFDGDRDEEATHDYQNTLIPKEKKIMTSMDLAANLVQFPYEAAQILRKMNATSEHLAEDIAKSFTTIEQKYTREPFETAMYSYTPATVYPKTANGDRDHEASSTNVTARKMSTLLKNTRTLEKRKRGHEHTLPFQEQYTALPREWKMVHHRRSRGRNKTRSQRYECRACGQKKKRHVCANIIRSKFTQTSNPKGKLAISSDCKVIETRISPWKDLVVHLLEEVPSGEQSESLILAAR